MAYVSNIFLEAGGDPLTINYQADQNDFMILCHARRFGSEPPEPALAGWSRLTYSNNSVNNYRNAIWTKVAGAAEPTSLTCTAGDNRHDLMIIVIKEADITTPMDVTPVSYSGGFSNLPTAPTITPTTNNCLLIHALFINALGMVPEPGYAFMALSSGGGGDILSYYSYAGAGSVAVPAHNYPLQNNTTHNPALCVFAIRDRGSGINEGHISYSSPPADVIHLLGLNGQTGHLTGTADVDLSATIGTLDGETVGNRLAANSTIGLSPGFISCGYRQNSIVQAGSQYGTALATGVNIENDIISVSSQGDALAYKDYSKFGKWLGMGDASNLRFFKIDSRDSKPTGRELPIPIVLEVDGGFHIASETKGTVGSSLLQNITHFSIAGPSDQRFSQNMLAFMYRLNTMILLGGSSSFPCNFEIAIRHALTGSLRTILNQGQQSTSQYFCLQNVQIGNGTYNTTFDCSRNAIAYPGTYNENERRINVQANAGSFEFSIYASSGCNIDFSSSTFDMGNFHKWTINSSTDTTTAVYNENGCTVITAQVTLSDIGRAIAGMFFTGCKQITLGTADLSGGGTTIDSSDDTYAIAVNTKTQLENLKNVTFSNNNYSIQINDNHGGGVWDLTGASVSGGTGSFDIQYTGTGALTINCDAGSGFSTGRCEATTGGASLTITTPPLTLSIKSDTAATDIRYFENDLRTAVDSTTGTQLDYLYPDTDPMDIELVKQGYVPVNRQDVTPYDGDYDVQMDFDEAYDSAHGLTITSEYDYVRATKVLTINSDQLARDIYSSLSDVIRLNSSYFNTKLLMAAIGPTRFDMIDGATVVNMERWKGAGSEIYDALDSSNPVEKWCSIKSVGTITGSSAYYRQTSSGNATTLTLTNNVVDEVFQYWSDPYHDGSTADGYDYSGYMVIKTFLAGSKQSRVDVLANQGLSALESYAYTVPLTNESHGYAGTDPGISADLTLVAGSPVGGKTFTYKWVDGGTNSGTDIADQINYNAATTPNGIVPGGTGLRYFELPDMVIYNATAVETEYGYEEGASPSLVGFYVEQAGLDHPDFTRFQSDDGTYYTPDTVAQISLPNVTGAGRVQVYNETAAALSAWQASIPYAEGARVLRTTGAGSELGDGVFFVCTSAGISGGSEPAWDVLADGNTTADNTVTWTVRPLEFDNSATSGAYSNTWTDGEHFTAGDTIRVRWATETKLEISTQAVATADGVSTVLTTPSDDDVYIDSGLTGSDYVTKFAADVSDIEIDIILGSDFQVIELYAWYKYLLTTATGIRVFSGGVTAIDDANFRINNTTVDVFFDNTTEANIKQTDNRRVYRLDEVYPVKDPTTGTSGTNGGGIDVVWRDKVFLKTTGGSALTPTESSKLLGLRDYNPESDTVEGSLTYQQSDRIKLAESSGKVAVSGSTVTFRDQADTKDRITATVDSNGQRTSVTVDGS